MALSKAHKGSLIVAFDQKLIKQIKTAELSTYSYLESCCLGISECSAEEDSLRDLLKRSDQALCRAKQSGRNCTVIWSMD